MNKKYFVSIALILTLLFVGCGTTVHHHYAINGGKGGGNGGSGNLKPHEEEIVAKQCFENPETEGTKRITECGYPSPENVGAEASVGNGGTGKKCSELTAMTWAEFESYLGSHKEVKEKDVSVPEGQSLYLENQGAGWVMKDDCFKADVPNDGTPVFQLLGTTGFTLISSNVEGVHQQTEYIDDGLRAEPSSFSNVKVEKSVFRNCIECIQGELEVTSSYIFANALLPEEAQHRENWYAQNQTVVAKKDTMFNPEWNVAIIFMNTPVGSGEKPIETCKDHLTIEESLVAGSKQMFSMCGKVKTTGAGAATAVIKNNRVARCLGTPETEGKGNTLCKGSNTGKWDQGFDAYGYFPNGGAGEIWGCLASESSYCPTGSNFTFTGNKWDNNESSISLAEAEG